MQQLDMFVWPKLPTLVASVIWDGLLFDSSAFLEKVDQRLGCATTFECREIFRNFKTDPRIQKLILTGRFSSAAELVLSHPGRFSSSDRRFVLRSLELLNEARRPFPKSRAFSRFDSENPRALHWVTNSLPHTQSGYSIRTQAVLRAQIGQGIDARGVTRLGYPVVIGRLPAREIDTVDDVKYRRLIPWVIANSPRRHRESSVRSLVKAGEQFHPHVLHTTTGYANALIVAEAAHRLKVPWVYEIRGELEKTWLSKIDREDRRVAESSDFYRTMRAQEVRAMQAADAVVALSEISKRQLVTRGVDKDKITVIPNGVDNGLVRRPFDQRKVRDELGLPRDKKIVGSVTSVVGYEGLDTVVRALPELPPESIIVIVGDGTALLGLKDLTSRLGLHDRVIFAGRQPHAEIWKWYAALDVFVVPRRDEAVTRAVTPIKPLQAMALGIPVIASDLDALREVTGGVADYVPASDTRAWAQTITKVLRDGAEVQPLQDFAETRTWSANGAKYLELYKSL